MVADMPDSETQKRVTEAILLWHTWFDAGRSALDQNKLGAAVEWFTEALRYACGCEANDYRRPLSEATLAYAHFRLSEQFDTCACDRCIPRPQRNRFCQLAEEQRKLAEQQANCAFAKIEVTHPELRLAKGRAAFVLANLRMRCGDYSSAASHFVEAFDLLKDVQSQVALVELILKHQIEVAYRLADDDSLLKAAGLLEPLLVAITGRIAELAWLLASKADAYLHFASYQRADDLFPRWKRLMARCLYEDQCSLQCAYGLEVFGRARLAMGHYDEAECLLARSAEIQQLLRPPVHPLIAFRVALARGELLNRRGHFRQADEQLTLAESLLPRCHEQYGPYSAESRTYFHSARGRWYLAGGQFDAAMTSFTTALNMARAESDCRYYLIVPALLGLARVESERSRVNCALVHVNEALCILDRANALSTAEAAWTMHELAYAYLQDNKIDQAEPASNRALDTVVLSLRRGHPDEISMRLARAQSLCAQHSSQEALKEVETARALLTKIVPEDFATAARCLRTEAEVYHARRQLSCAKDLLRCASNLWAEHECLFGKTHPERCLITIAYATVFAGEDDTAKASSILIEAQFFEQALRLKLCAEYLGYELNRRGNLFFAHHLYREAFWLYSLAVGQYEHEGQADNPLVVTVRANMQKACDRLAEIDADCPCVPWHTACKKRPCCPCSPSDTIPHLCCPR